ncbi:MAG: serpin family protein [Ruminococcaceae bacterium]|nr:serpin family protein [Oscillospiraceae bacterium]
MKKKILAVLAAMLSLTACSKPDKPENSGGMVAGRHERTMMSSIEVTEDNVLNSVRLFDAVGADKTNSMFSPLSLNMALGMLAEGAEGTSKEALDKYLGTSDYGTFAESYMRLAKDNYNGKVGKDENYFEIANSFWGDDKFPFKREYKDAVTQKFGAEIRNMDFDAAEKVVSEVNRWVSDKTHKMIPTLLESIEPETVAILVNTVYFESAWSDEWKYDTKNKDLFTLLDGSTKELTLMRKSGGAYFENDRATAFGSTYKNGLEFIGILPKETGEFTIEDLDIPSLLESRSNEYDVTERMPKLTFDTELPLADALSAAGLSELFDRDRADLSGMSEDPIWVSDVLQKTRLELDEHKTKAAAATAVMVNGISAAPPEQKILKEVFLDRPFAFLIYDPDQELIVFIGKVAEP